MKLFSRREEPLPAAILLPPTEELAEAHGIQLGDNFFWDVEQLPNGHVVILGASGSGKTQTLKAMAWELSMAYEGMQVIIIDFHGDLSIEGETVYALDMESPHGINPLVVNLDPKGGGSAMQALVVTSVFAKALNMGSNQEGLFLTLLNNAYSFRGIHQDLQKTWVYPPPTFTDVKEQIEYMADNASTDKSISLNDLNKMELKLAKTFQLGVFSKPQPALTDPIIRFDLHRLPPEIQSIAAETLARQLMDQHRLQGEIDGRIPRTFLVIDEAKQMPRTQDPALNRIFADGRKFGLSTIVATQTHRGLERDVIANAATVIVLPVSAQEVKGVANLFRFNEHGLAKLAPLEAFCRMGRETTITDIIPYYQRIAA